MEPSSPVPDPGLHIPKLLYFRLSEKKTQNQTWSEINIRFATCRKLRLHESVNFRLLSNEDLQRYNGFAKDSCQLTKCSAQALKASSQVVSLH
jgi:hypothetical protein